MQDDKRDPRIDPKPGDVVRHISKIGAGPSLTVEAVISNLVAYTSGLSSEVHWVTKDQWCKPSVITKEWEIVHVAQ